MRPARARGGDHSSGTGISAGLERPTRRHRMGHPIDRTASRRGSGRRLPIWSCSVWGLACHPRYRRRGVLLPHLFTLAPGRIRPKPVAPGAVCFLCHFPSGRPARVLPGTLPCGVRTFLPAAATPEGAPAAQRSPWRAAARTVYRKSGGRHGAAGPAEVALSRRRPGRCRTARASCRGCCAGSRSLRRSW